MADKVKADETTIYGFYLNDNTELICVYDGPPPNMQVNSAGDLIWTK